MQKYIHMYMYDPFIGCVTLKYGMKDEYWSLLQDSYNKPSVKHLKTLPRDFFKTEVGLLMY